MIRNRIQRHVRVRAGDLVPHELNPRRHSDAQRQTLAELYREIGFAPARCWRMSCPMAGSSSSMAICGSRSILT